MNFEFFNELTAKLKTGLIHTEAAFQLLYEEGRKKIEELEAKIKGYETSQEAPDPTPTSVSETAPLAPAPDANSGNDPTPPSPEATTPLVAPDANSGNDTTSTPVVPEGATAPDTGSVN